MKRRDWPETVRLHLAAASVGNTTLMMQAGKGRIGRAREYLRSQVLLTGLSQFKGAHFAEFLNANTNALSLELRRPEDNKPNWGAARKVLSIFLRQCAMNKDLNPAFKLATVEPFLEVPLDSQIVGKIDKLAVTGYASNFRIKSLEPALNSEIQKVALGIASSEGLHRYELDVLFWNSSTN